MLEKLTEISKILLIPAIIFYAFGFITITAHLAQFGMVTFDIFNARFLIAGLYASISLAVVLFAAWELYSNLLPEELFETNKWQKRYSFYVAFISAVFGASFTITSFLSIGSSILKSSATEPQLFRPWFPQYLGKIDFIGPLLNFIHFPFGSSLDFILKTTIYIFGYISLVVLASIFLMTIKTWLKKPTAKSIIDNKSEQNAVPTTSKEHIKEPGTLVTFLILFIDIFCVCFFSTLLYFCALKVTSSIVNIHSIGLTSILNYNLLFSWIFSSIFGIYIFLYSFKFPRGQVPLWSNGVRAWFANFGSLNSVQYAFQQSIIPVIVSLFFFGCVIFPRVPFFLGGGEAREVKIFTTTPVPALTEGKTYLIDESGDYLFVVEKSTTTTAFELSRSIVYDIETKTDMATSSNGGN